MRPLQNNRATSLPAHETYIPSLITKINIEKLNSWDYSLRLSYLKTNCHPECYLAQQQSILNTALSFLEFKSNSNLADIAEVSLDVFSAENFDLQNKFIVNHKV